MRPDTKIKNFEAVLRRPGPLLISLVIVTLFRNGFGLYGEQRRSFGHGDHNFSFNEIELQDPIRMLFSEIGKTYGWTFFILLYSIVFFVFIAIASLIIKNRNMASPKLILMLSMLPGFTIIFGRYGTFDLFSFGFSVLAGLSVGKSYQFLFLMGMLFSHVESTFIVTLVISILFLIPKHKENSKRLLGNQMNYAVTAAFSGATSVYLSLQPGEGSRMEQFPQLLRISLEQFLSSGSWLIISWLGGLWYIFFMSLRTTNSSQIQYATILISALGAFSIVTADGTRVAVNTLTMILVAFIAVINKEVVVNKLWIYAALLFPALNISNFNIFLPFRQLMYFFGLNPQVLILGN